MATKAQMLKVIESLPDGATIRDAIERLEDIELDELRVADAEARANGEGDPGTRRPFRPMTKDELVRRISDLPKDATVEDAVQRLEFIKTLEESMAEAEAHPDRSMPHDEVVRRLEAGERLTSEYPRERPEWAMTIEEMAARISALPDTATIVHGMTIWQGYFWWSTDVANNVRISRLKIPDTFS